MISQWYFDLFWWLQYHGDTDKSILLEGLKRQSRSYRHIQTLSLNKQFYFNTLLLLLSLLLLWFELLLILLLFILLLLLYNCIIIVTIIVLNYYYYCYFLCYYYYYYYYAFCISVCIYIYNICQYHITHHVHHVNTSSNLC